MSSKTLTVMLAALLSLLLGGCPAATGRETRLSEESYRKLREELREGGARGDAGALRDLAWLTLMRDGVSGEPLALFERALTRTPRDRRALLGRAMILVERGEDRLAHAALADLLRGCTGAGDAECIALRSFALSQLVELISEGEPLPLALLESELAARPDPLTRAQILEAMILVLKRAGRPDEADRRARLLSCPSEWQVSGPHHHLAHADLKRPMPPAETHTVATDACGVRLHSSPEEGGVYSLATQVESRAPLPLILTVDTQSPWLLEIGDAIVFVKNPADKRPSSRTRLRLVWPAGRHRLALRLGAGGSEAAVRVAVAPDGVSGRLSYHIGPVSSQRAPAPLPVVTEVGCGPAPEELLHQGTWPSFYLPLTELLSAQRSLLCGDLDQAHRALEEAVNVAPSFVPPRRLAGQVLLRDPVIPEQVAAQRGLRLLAEATRLDPSLGRAALEHALLSLRLDRVEQALAQLQRGSRTWPHQARWWAGLSQAHRERYYGNEEEAALERALALAPARCEALESLIAVRQSRRRVGDLGSLVRRARECDARSESLARFLRDEGRVDAAVVEYGRLLRLRPDSLLLRRERARLLLVLGRRRDAEAELRRLLHLHPESAEDVVRLADVLAAAGAERAALDLLRGAAERSPTRQEIRGALERLEGRSAMATYRVSGLEAIERFRRRGRTYEAPAVLVQDRMVTRILPGGGKLMLTHNIIQVLAKEGIDRWAEAQLPARAEVLTLRSIKTDGTVREPEEIVGKRSVSLPDLEVGDFVEMEYLDAEEAPRGFAGTAPQRFYFGSFEVPLALSEYVVVAPLGVPLQLESRGNIPRPTRLEKDGLVELRWVAHDQDRLVPEPHSVSPDEYTPSIKIAAGTSWDRWRATLIDWAIPALRATWQVQAVAQRTAGGRDPRRGAEAVYREVMERIDLEGPRAQSAGQTLARGRGSRHALLVALLRALGIPAELWRVKPITDDQAPVTIPDPRAYRAPLVYCPLPGGPVFLDPRDSVPFGYVSPELRGAPALRTAEGGQALVVIPQGGHGAGESRRVDATVRLVRDGGAQVSVTESLLGGTAHVLRTIIRKVDAAEVRKRFEQGILAAYFPGAILDRLEFGGERVIEEPLRMRYEFRVPGLARQDPAGLQLGIGFFAPHLTRIYLQVAHRSRAFRVAHHDPLTVELTVSAADGLRRAALLPPVNLRTPFGSLERTVSDGPQGTLRVRTRLDIAFRRVSPGEYPAFSRFARQVDDHFRAEILFRPAARGR